MFHQFLGERHGDGKNRFEVTLLDIQELNNRIDQEEFDFCKVSSVHALRRRDCYTVCRAGASLGFGVGPLLLKRQGAAPLDRNSKVLCPGKGTTATALFRAFYPQADAIEHVVFSDIMPTLTSDDADYGVVIHEGRFTYQEFGLEMEADLGSLWEKKHLLPLPLGCIVAHKRLDQSIVESFEQTLRSSISAAYSDRDKAFAVMQKHAQELKPEAIWAHVDLYVNDWSLDLGVEGQQAFEQLEHMLF